MLAKLLVVLAGIALSACISVPKDALNSITSFEALSLHQRGDAVVIIDVRPARERQDGLVSNSLWIKFGPDTWTGHVSSEESREFIEKIISLGFRKEIILLCQEGVRSEAARRELYRNGIWARSVSDGFMGNNHGPGWKAWEVTN